MKRPKIVVRGDNPDCVHYERIVGEIGTCQLCGQVRDYSGTDPEKNDFFVKKGRKGSQANVAVHSH